jgi:catechol 2,3-dioxygenase-like lactoylglutathione lyase family enzyme
VKRRKAGRVRIARSTRRFEQMTRFYRDGLGLALVDHFENHAGYAGTILALPGGAELEITRHARGRAAVAPDPDDLLVLYLPTAVHVVRWRQRLERHGYVAVQPVNPYWLGKAVTFADPDGWRVVLCDEAAG